MSFPAYGTGPTDQSAFLPCIPGDANLDPGSLYNADTGLTMSSAAGDYAPNIPFRQILVEGGASGQAAAITVKVAYCNGGYMTWTLPAIAARGSWILPYSGKIAGIYKTGTTAILVFPLF